MKCADLFCGAGGAAMGLHRAGFDVTGWDIRPQPNYPFAFNLGDALAADLSGFDFVWASPPCQAHSNFRHMPNHSPGKHPDLIPATRAKLQASGLPWIIENVEGSPLVNPCTLCGSSFGLLVQRHRLFESSMMLMELECEHGRYVADKPSLHRLQGVSRVVGCYGHARGKGDTVALWREAMGITWMSRRELSQAIPPAYTEFLGRQVMRSLESKIAA